MQWAFPGLRALLSFQDTSSQTPPNPIQSNVKFLLFNQQVGVFIVSIFKLNASFCNFILTEKTKSSTQLMQNIIDEWENIFARDVNLVLLKSFVYIIRNIGE